jgi:hypothetical protein
LNLCGGIFLGLKHEKRPRRISRAASAVFVNSSPSPENRFALKGVYSFRQLGNFARGGVPMQKTLSRAAVQRWHGLIHRRRGASFVAAFDSFFNITHIGAELAAARPVYGGARLGLANTFLGGLMVRHGLNLYL